MEESQRRRDAAGLSAYLSEGEAVVEPHLLPSGPVQICARSRSNPRVPQHLLKKRKRKEESSNKATATAGGPRKDRRSVSFLLFTSLVSHSLAFLSVRVRRLTGQPPPPSVRSSPAPFFPWAATTGRAPPHFATYSPATITHQVCPLLLFSPLFLPSYAKRAPQTLSYLNPDLTHLQLVYTRYLGASSFCKKKSSAAHVLGLLLVCIHAAAVKVILGLEL
jgi:hypothetical protein